MNYINGPFDKISIKLLPVHSDTAHIDVACLIWSLIYRAAPPGIDKLLNQCDSKMPIPLRDIISRCLNKTCKLPDEIEQLYNINFYNFYLATKPKLIMNLILCTNLRCMLLFCMPAQ